ncbi:GGDEF domain-containing protein [Marinomonas shanghaiensis]|uniref:GGDEF domain-containing protein n=1 Tax=Marinomonas shanghaiensis TaxID=2202418 RepID=UPI001E6401C4|nr:GGDEF domain-containing protein [Marinomonas shanghaiensis]
MKKQLSTTHWFNEALFNEALLKGFLLVIGSACSVLIVVNLLAAKYQLALIETVLLMLTIFVWFCSQQSRFYKWTLLIYVAFIFACILTGISYSPLHSGRQVWVLIFPMTSYLMLGKKTGVWLSGICLGLVISILYLRFYEDFGKELISVVINLSCAYAFLWGLTHGAERVHKKMLYALKKIASTDPLTGLANRRNISQHFQYQLQQAIGESDALALVLIDLDNFKKINDTHGHDVGDAVLVDFAERLRAHVDDSDQLFRLGGEEFCVLMPAANRHDWSTSFCHYVQDAVFYWDDLAIRYTISIGVSCSFEGEGDFKSLYRLADQRLYAAKNLGRNRIVFAD